MIEAGLGSHRIADWFGLVGPAGMPAAIVQRLNAEIVKASREQSLVKRLTDNGTLIATSTPQEMDAMIRNEVKNTGALVRALGLQVK